jgi:ATP-binding protein involved in chromosome partitioning
MTLEDKIIEKLRDVNDPELHRSIVDLGMVEGVDVANGSANIRIKLTIPGCPLKARINQDITEAVTQLDGIDRVNIDFTAMNEEERKALRTNILGEQEPEEMPHIADRLLAVSSGKGGVGKSTVTANLARAFAEDGKSVGVLDADVYGFSIPRMLGVQTDPTIIDNMIIPAVVDDIKVVSMGFFVPEGEPVVWRGPLLHKAITQFMSDVVWDNLDVLLMDLPPGTGDVTITIGQKLPESEMIVVTTPQPAAAEVASRVAAMAQKTNLKVLGVIENMSYYILPDSSREYIFGKDGGKTLAERIGAQFLGEIPLDKSVREYADSGRSLFTDGTEIADAYRTICSNILNGS